MIYWSTSQKQRELKHCRRFLRLTKTGKLTEVWANIKVCSEPVKLTEVTDKRLLKATPKGRKILIFADNSDYAYVGGVSLLRTLDETTVFVASSPMLFGWFESFALQNLQAFSKYEVTNVNVHILLWESVYTSFMSEFDVVSVFRYLPVNYKLKPLKCR